jgi:hypothetical protein
MLMKAYKELLQANNESQIDGDIQILRRTSDGPQALQTKRSSMGTKDELIQMANCRRDISSRHYKLTKIPDLCFGANTNPMSRRGDGFLACADSSFV